MKQEITIPKRQQDHLLPYINIAGSNRLRIAFMTLTHSKRSVLYAEGQITTKYTNKLTDERIGE